MYGCENVWICKWRRGNWGDCLIDSIMLMNERKGYPGLSQLRFEGNNELSKTSLWEVEGRACTWPGLLSELEGPTSILFTGVSAEQVHLIAEKERKI